MLMARAFLLLLTSIVLVAGCGGGGRVRSAGLRAPVETTALGPGDVFTLQIVGEKDLPEEYQVASDGSVELPYVEHLEVGGLEPQEIASRVKKFLREHDILVRPVVIIQVKEYNSRKITVTGQVQKPGSFPYSPGASLIQAISLAGGFTASAKMDAVKVTRITKTGEVTVVVDAESINESGSADVPLQAGDRVYVPQRIF